ncbi:hypothetical protein F4820DRAFT_133085 [Hypoxylon rubiginosum]|uniref:Uncharacterized protein n=1 Tax=Hypoxylon rubiginosum TaxID=110542 RepID=A0ACB9YLJ9_9PEZI|nr:hypothetical protein F4820DRAFT_133085 [Hypoxylon rubiginosum]
MSGLAPDTGQPSDKAAYPTATAATPGSAAVPPPCECWPATLRIVDICQSCSQASSSPFPSSANVEVGNSTDAPPGVALANTLAVARNLVQHWGAVNGCPNAEAHMDARMLCRMVDAIGLVLRDHEKAIDGASAAPRASPRTFVGRVELDAGEAAIVAQEALKHSLVRLAAMLQDIEEESAWLGRRTDEEATKEKNPLGDREVKGLITRLFRMLGNVNRLDTA